ncbi:MAG: hypothetical protein ACE15B_20380 [Bryobacteraceae bacterium]
MEYGIAVVLAILGAALYAMGYRAGMASGRNGREKSGQASHRRSNLVLLPAPRSNNGAYRRLHDVRLHALADKLAVRRGIDLDRTAGEAGNQGETARRVEGGLAVVGAGR